MRFAVSIWLPAARSPTQQKGPLLVRTVLRPSVARAQGDPFSEPSGLEVEPQSSATRVAGRSRNDLVQGGGLLSRSRGSRVASAPHNKILDQAESRDTLPTAGEHTIVRHVRVPGHLPKPHNGEINHVHRQPLVSDMEGRGHLISLARNGRGTRDTGASWIEAQPVPGLATSVIRATLLWSLMFQMRGSPTRPSGQRQCIS